ncbi:phosphonate C-P lyase system protein PhnG [Pelorhabdus rhamnosifermentans]|jgi:alpha-D-ribose 1-methylphosphonate 5-triphosphate synthase subunit PhnG|uniref:phosphonate C-P lyase system protein PhnG n=1 Tax=Pelorhabdus rhamnosifermentans TaxID=2772457 RepID=UPI001C064275|nr:phosphonate C-P lyase system protein PhnG [Pelorhabdus rhamnosifermentans]
MEFREIMAEGNLSVWEDAAEMIAARHDIKVLQQPETCMTMMQALDSVGHTPFYVGEILMTEAVVSINEATGFGFALEDEPVRALCIAIIDAAFTAHIEEEVEIRHIVAAEEQRILKRQQQEAALVAATQVRFDIMEG